MRNILLWTAAISGVLALTVGAASASTFTDAQFDFDATGSGGGTGVGAVTIGTPTSGGFYTVTEGSFISALKGCLSCTVTENLTELFFDSATLGLTGTVTGSYVGDDGDPYTFTLGVTDAPTLTWDFSKDNQVTDIVTDASGTYYLDETPLPAALPLFASGLGAMGLFGWRRKRKNTVARAAA